MSVTGLCEVCQQQEATDRCERCGSLVCFRHYDRGVGYCTSCASETGGETLR